MRKGDVRKVPPPGLNCPSPSPVQPSVPVVRALGVPGGHLPRPFRKHQGHWHLVGLGTTQPPEAMHCNAGLQDFLQQPSGWTGLCGHPSQRALCCLARVRPRRRQEGDLLKAKGTLRRGALREVAALCSSGPGPPASKLWVWVTSQHPLQWMLLALTPRQPSVS